MNLKIIEMICFLNTDKSFFTCKMQNKYFFQIKLKAANEKIINLVETTANLCIDFPLLLSELELHHLQCYLTSGTTTL